MQAAEAAAWEADLAAALEALAPSKKMTASPAVQALRARVLDHPLLTMLTPAAAPDSARERLLRTKLQRYLRHFDDDAKQAILNRRLQKRGRD